MPAHHYADDVEDQAVVAIVHLLLEAYIKEEKTDLVIVVHQKIIASEFITSNDVMKEDHFMINQKLVKEIDDIVVIHVYMHDAQDCLVPLLPKREYMLNLPLLSDKKLPTIIGGCFS
jgi:hypothetical protein